MYPAKHSVHLRRSRLRVERVFYCRTAPSRQAQEGQPPLRPRRRRGAELGGGGVLRGQLQHLRQSTAPGEYQEDGEELGLLG